MITPYDSKEGKKKQVKQMFNNIASKYDFLNRFLSLGIDVIWRQKAIALLKLKSEDKVLDIATGTGDMAIEIAKQYNSQSITGIDISDQMLAIGQKKILAKKLNDRIKLLEGDSENLDFESNSFDAVTVAFGVRNFEDLDKGLFEMFRVLKSGGQVLVLEFSRPNVFPFKQLFNGYFKYVLPAIGRVTSKDAKAYKYLYESVQSFPEGQNFVTKLEEAGFKNCTCKRLTLGICSIYLAYK